MLLACDARGSWFLDFQALLSILLDGEVHGFTPGVECHLQ